MQCIVHQLLTILTCEAIQQCCVNTVLSSVWKGTCVQYEKKDIITPLCISHLHIDIFEQLFQGVFTSNHALFIANRAILWPAALIEDTFMAKWQPAVSFLLYLHPFHKDEVEQKAKKKIKARKRTKFCFCSRAVKFLGPDPQHGMKLMYHTGLFWMEVQKARETKVVVIPTNVARLTYKLQRPNLTFPVMSITLVFLFCFVYWICNWVHIKAFIKDGKTYDWGELEDELLCLITKENSGKLPGL